MSKRKNFYAIKDGNGVKNKIVTTWEECQKYVLHYNAVYKGFVSLEEANNYLKNMSDDEVEERKDKQHIKAKREKEDKSQNSQIKTKNNKINAHKLNEELDDLYNYISDVMDSLEDDNYKRKQFIEDLNTIESKILSMQDYYTRFE